MDDAVFERWSQTLEALRLERKNEMDRLVSDKADSFKPAEFYELTLHNLERTMEQWLAFEQEGTVASTKALQAIRIEMDSVLDFELESIERDVAMVTSRITWKPDEHEEARRKFLGFADEIRKKYHIKLKSLSPVEVKSALSAEPVRAVQYSGSSRGSGSGFTAVVMLLVGLLLGGGMSIYFRDAAKKAETRCQEEKQKILADQRVLADNTALLRSSYSDLVTGKSQPIPVLQDEMNRIKKIYDEKIAAVNSEFSIQQSHMGKKVSSDRLEQALADLEREHKRRIKVIDDEYQPSLRVFEKRILLYKDLLNEPAAP